MSALQIGAGGGLQAPFTQPYAHLAKAQLLRHVLLSGLQNSNYLQSALVLQPGTGAGLQFPSTQP